MLAGEEGDDDDDDYDDEDDEGEESTKRSRLKSLYRSLSLSFDCLVVLRRRRRRIAVGSSKWYDLVFFS